MKKSVLLPLLLLLLLASAPAGEAKVGMILPPMNTEFWRSVRDGAEAAAPRLDGLVLTVVAPAREINVEQQIQKIEELAAEKIDVLIIAPVDEVQITPLLTELNTRGIRIIILESDTLWPDKAAFVGPNNVMGGYMAADYIVKRLNGVGKVTIITGELGHGQAVYRTNGAREAFRMNRGMRLVGVRSAGWERSRAMAEMESLLTTDPDIDAVFCCSDEMAMGALEAIRAAKANTFVVGFDASGEALKSIARGELAATVAQNSANIGRMSVSSAYRLATGKKIPPLIDTGIELVTGENVERFIVDQFMGNR